MDIAMNDRVRELIRDSDHTQKDVATRVGMTPDALSRAVSGQRGFGSLELVRIADLFGVEVHWLITGEPDPNALRLAARHSYDHDTATYANATRTADAQLLDDVRLAYVQAYPGGVPDSLDVSTDPCQVRAGLGEGFVRQFAQRLEERQNVDVVRINGLGTDYSMAIGGRDVIALTATATWGRANWSLAHELGHVAHRHHIAADTVAHSDAAAEREANAFAAELLLPADEIAAIDWTNLSIAELGQRIWNWGVSTEALRTRLAGLSIALPSHVREALVESTQSFLRNRALPASMWREIADRQWQSTSRRFPTHLTLAHEAAIAEGRLGRATLAWMLDVHPDKLEVDEPATLKQESDEQLAAALGLLPA